MRKLPYLFVFIMLWCPWYLNGATPPTIEFEIVGVSDDIKINIQTRLAYFINNAQRNRALRQLLTSSTVEVRKAIEPFGYFHAKVQAESYYRNNHPVFRYVISLGPPVIITHFSVNLSGPGRNTPSLMNFIHCSPLLKTGMIFSAPEYEAYKRELFKLAKNCGYLQATFNNKVIIDKKRNTAIVQIVLNTGEQFYFGPVIFKTHPYSLNFLRRFIPFHVCDVFSSLRLLKIQQQMEKSYYFKRVYFKPDFEHIVEHMVPVELYAYAREAFSYSVGGGYGTLTGPRLSGSLSLRHIGDEGHHLEARAKLSSVLSNASIYYYIPGNNPLTEEWFMGANYKSFSPKSGRSQSATLTGGYSFKTDHFQNSWDINFLKEKFVIFDARPWHYVHEFFPGWRIAYLNSDDLINPKNAFYASLLLQAGSDEILSTNSFLKGHFRAKIIASPYSLGKFILRGEVGAIDTNKLFLFPFSMRYFAGGINSIRGFADSSIGPGKYIGIASAEYQHRVYRNFSGAIFYDVGNAANHFSGPLNRGAGVGIICDTRLGPIRVYLAQALSKKSHPKSVEFSIGPEFS